VITAFYREGGDSNTAAADVRLRYQADNDLGKARAAIFEKWLPKWTGEKVNALIGQLDQSVLLCEQDAQIHRELKRNTELQHEVNRELKRNTELQHEVNSKDMQINELVQQIKYTQSQLDQLQAHIEQQAQHIAQQTKHVGELERRLNAIYDSTSWRLMGPVRRVSRALTTDKNSDADSSDLDR
jgi:septal ring factor EnvC (AmiA/AmiB activator)